MGKYQELANKPYELSWIRCDNFWTNLSTNGYLTSDIMLTATNLHAKFCEFLPHCELHEHVKHVPTDWYHLQDERHSLWKWWPHCRTKWKFQIVWQKPWKKNSDVRQRLHISNNKNLVNEDTGKHKYHYNTQNKIKKHSAISGNVWSYYIWMTIDKCYKTADVLALPKCEILH
jgi:hypothetical protein